MAPQQALEAVADALERLPPAVGAALRRLSVHVASCPTPAEVAAGIPANVAGVYLEPDPRSLPPTDDDEPPPPSGGIVLYLDNIRPLDAAGVQAIFLHEAAHALGLDEAAVEAVGL